MISELHRQLCTLDNGLRVVTVEMPHLHTLTLALYVKVGSRFETAADNGLSHFVEHMLFRGTERYPSSYDINFAFERLGGTLYAETGRDHSLYQVCLAPDLLEAGLELFGELFLRPRFADIELERQIILEELNEDLNEDGQEINGDDIARGLLFQGHPLSQRIIGPAANVERFTLDDVRRHFGHFYCGRNAILAAAGPVQAGAVLAAARRHLAALPPGQEARHELKVDLPPGPHQSYVADPGSQSTITVLFRSVAETDDGYMPSVALARALDDGMATRLHYRLCDQAGLAYSVQASLEPLGDISLLDIGSATAHGKVRELLTQLFELLDELRREPISPAELDKIIHRYRFDLATTADDPNAMVGWYGGTLLYYEPPSLAHKAAAMQQVTAADVRAVAGQILRSERLAVSIIGSVKGATQRRLRELVASVLG
jgi:predicted Zn-dependent peptidase